MSFEYFLTITLDGLLYQLIRFAYSRNRTLLLCLKFGICKGVRPAWRFGRGRLFLNSERPMMEKCTYFKTTHIVKAPQPKSVLEGPRNMPVEVNWLFKLIVEDPNKFPPEGRQGKTEGRDLKLLLRGISSS